MWRRTGSPETCWGERDNREGPMGRSSGRQESLSPGTALQGHEEGAAQQG